MKKYLLMNGPNLNMLGIREPEVYGTTTLATIEEQVVAHGRERGVQVDCFQSNHEGDLVDKLHQAHFDYDGVVYNPGAHTHYLCHSRCHRQHKHSGGGNPHLRRGRPGALPRRERGGAGLRGPDQGARHGRVLRST